MNTCLKRCLAKYIWVIQSWFNHGSFLGIFLPKEDRKKICPNNIFFFFKFNAKVLFFICCQVMDYSI